MDKNQQSVIIIIIIIIIPTLPQMFIMDVKLSRKRSRAACVARRG
jgi:hypothetical protein